MPSDNTLNLALRRSSWAVTAFILLGHIVISPSKTNIPALIFFLLFGYLYAYQQRKISRFESLGVAIFACIAVGFTYKTLLGKEAGVSLLVWLACIKWLETRSLRDLQVHSSLLLFLIIGALLWQENVWVLLWALFAVWAVFAVLAQAYGAQGAFNLSLAKESLKLMLYGVPLALALFYLFPRIAGPLWSLPSDANAGRSGLSDTLKMGSVQQLVLNDEIAFRVKFANPASVPPEAQRYWRGFVLSEFDGSQWRPQNNDATLAAARLVTSNAAALPYTAQYSANRLSVRPSFESTLVNAPDLRSNSEGSAQGSPMFEAEVRELTAYPLALWAQPNNSRIALQAYLNLPPSYNPQTMQFAAQLRQKIGLQEAKPAPFIAAMLNYYRTENFSYTLQPAPHARGIHAIDGFLFDSKSGFCEHYAASFVAVMRALDFPARVVLGYQGGSLNSQDGWLTVRQSDAHAWAEVFDGEKWLRVDPTAAVAPWRVDLNSIEVGRRLGLSGAGAAQGSPILWWRERGELLHSLWQNWFLNYGVAKQKDLFQRLGLDTADWRSFGGAMLGVAGFAVLFAAYLFRPTRRRLTPHQLALQLFDQKLKRLKLAPRAAAQSPRDYVIAAGNETLNAWLTRYEALLFSQTNEANLKAIKQALK